MNGRAFGLKAERSEYPKQDPPWQELYWRSLEKEKGLKAALIEHHRQINYWRAQHHRAAEREKALKEEVKRLKARNEELEEQVAELERIRAKLALREQQLFGRRSEADKKRDDSLEGENEDSTRPRGAQKGQKGHGRRIHSNLPEEEEIRDLPEEQRKCPRCGKPFEEFPGTEDSEEIEWTVRLFRRVHKRRRYKPTCTCDCQAGIVTAPVAPKLIPKGMFSTGFWTRLIIEKYFFQIPLSRIIKQLNGAGLKASQGTLTGGLQRIALLVQPLYVLILEESRRASHWHMDETRWLVFEELKGKKGHEWWLWVVVTQRTVCFILDPSRSSDVPKSLLGNASGILNVDRYSAYRALSEDICLSYCWAHVRRDFKGVIASWKKLRCWAEEWLERIGELYRLNKKRLREPRGSGAFIGAHRELGRALSRMEERRDQELCEENLHPAKKKVLRSLAVHWEGLLIFYSVPEIPMDNNEAERCLRNPVVGRKNYYGAGSIWSGMLSASLFTILQTVERNGLNPILFLREYFEACAQNKGKPPDNVAAFLPWNVSEKRREAWQIGQRPP